MRTLGMIGGTSWHSTIIYYRLINEMVGRKIGAQGNPPLIIHSLNIELMRSRDWDRINAEYLETAMKLEKAGAEAIVICANTPHVVYDYVAPRIQIPFLHIADATGREAVAQGLGKLGLLGNMPTMTGGFIRDYLAEKFGIDTVIPTGSDLERSHYFVSQELTQGEFTDEARDFYLGQVKRLGDAGAEGIILGCTELPILMNGVGSDIPMLHTTDLHAQMAADFILGNANQYN